MLGMTRTEAMSLLDHTLLDSFFVDVICRDVDASYTHTHTRRAYGIVRVPGKLHSLALSLILPSTFCDLPECIL